LSDFPPFPVSLPSSSGDFFSLDSEGGGGPEGFEGELPDPTDLPVGSWVGFGETPEWRLGFPER
jgi:hypothetical protein